jgi:hypothetical protein
LIVDNNFKSIGISIVEEYGGGLFMVLEKQDGDLLYLYI